MFEMLPSLFAVSIGYSLFMGGAALLFLVALVLVIALSQYGALWLQAFMCGADVRLLSLIGMSLRQVKPSMIVSAKIMATQAGLSINREHGMSTARMEAHFLAGGDLMRVVRAIIAAHRAGIELDFSRAAAVDLAGRDVLDAVRISVFPKVIDCPETLHGGRTTLSAVAKNGVELRIRARVTVRTNLDQLIGGATEETIIARVGQGIISAIGKSGTHMEVMEMPSRISKGVLESGLDASTAFEIVSIDISEIAIGENIGARLQTDQAEADTRIAQAQAETRRADAVASQQEMKAKLAESRAILVLAEAEVPLALAYAFKEGQLQVRRANQRERSHAKGASSPYSAFDRISDPRLPPAGRSHPAKPIIRSE